MIGVKELTRRRKPLWFILPLFLCILLFQEGCGKKEPPKSEKPASVESKEGANQEEKRPKPVICVAHAWPKPATNTAGCCHAFSGTTEDIRY
jgi:hypothetical protein